MKKALFIIIILTLSLTGCTLLNNTVNKKVSDGCITSGCSGELCIEESEVGKILTICEFRPEYECFKYSSCQRQSDGICGWTQNPKYLECLEEQSEKIQPVKDDYIILHGPTENQLFISPGSFNGAVGNSWFVNNFLNVIVVDDNYKELGRIIVNRPQDFNEERNIGGFYSQVEFEQSETEYGYFIIVKPDVSINDPNYSYKRRVRLIKPVIEDAVMPVN